MFGKIFNTFRAPEGDSNQFAHRFNAATALGKYFFIRSHLNGLVLDVKDGCQLPGSPVITWRQKPTVIGNENQLWYEDLSTGTLRSAVNDYCLDLAGNTVVLNPYLPGNPNQQWTRAHDAIRNRMNPHTVIDIADNNSQEGARVCAWTETGYPNQRWDFTHQLARFFYIKSKMHGKVVDVKGDNRAPGAEVIMYTAWPDPRDNQLWYEDTRGIIRSKLNNFAFDSSGGKFKLQPYQPNVPEQQWVFGQDGRIHKVTCLHEVMDVRGALHARQRISHQVQIHRGFESAVAPGIRVI